WCSRPRPGRTGTSSTATRSRTSTGSTRRTRRGPPRGSCTGRTTSTSPTRRRPASASRRRTCRPTGSTRTCTRAATSPRPRPTRSGSKYWRATLRCRFGPRGCPRAFFVLSSAQSLLVAKPPTGTGVGHLLEEYEGSIDERSHSLIPWFHIDDRYTYDGRRERRTRPYRRGRHDPPVAPGDDGRAAGVVRHPATVPEHLRDALRADVQGRVLDNQGPEQH